MRGRASYGKQMTSRSRFQNTSTRRFKPFKFSWKEGTITVWAQSNVTTREQEITVHRNKNTRQFLFASQRKIIGALQ